MYTNAVILVLATSASLVCAHGKIAVATGDMGGNTTAIGIQGGAVPGAGPNSKTEVDTTVFQQRNAMTDGLGKTEGQGKNTMAMMDNVMAQSGSTLPQVSSGGSIKGTLHIVTTDGAGPYTAVVDPTAQGTFSQGTKAEVTTQVPGRNGNIAPGPLSNNLLKRALWHMGIIKRALNVDQDYPFAVQVPAGTTCSGSVGNMQNVCLVKLANPSGAGPFGGVIAFQMAAGNSTAAVPAVASAAPATTASGSSISSTSTESDDDEETGPKAGKKVIRSAKFRQS